MVNEPKKNFDTSVTLSGLRLDNPVVPASGTFGYGNEYKDFYDINILGSFSFKGTTREARFGNPTPRIAECTAGLINAVGLQNPGIDAVIGEELPRLKTFFRKPVIANISGFSVEEYAYCCERIDKEEQVGLIEVNVSCPNVRHGGMSFGTSPEAAAEVTRAVKAVTTKPVYIKLSPNVTDIVAIARACEQAGADGICLINTMLGMRIDVKCRKPIIANVMGGFSGAAIFPVAVRMVYQVAKACSVPVMGCGGVTTARDVIEKLFFSDKRYDLGDVGRYRINKKLDLDIDPAIRTLTREDIIAIIKYLIQLINSKTEVDDIDHLSNRRVRTVGEQLSNQFSVGFVRMARTIRERMNVRDNEVFTPVDLINAKTLSSVINSFFGT